VTQCRVIALALFACLGAVWSVPCQTVSLARRSAQSAPASAASETPPAGHASHHGGGHRGVPESGLRYAGAHDMAECAGVPSLTPTCTCGCDKGPVAGGVRLSPGWALIASTPEAPRPERPPRPGDAPRTLPGAPSSLPDPIPLPA